MNIDLSKIVAEPVSIYVAERTSEVNPVSLPPLEDLETNNQAVWKYLGARQKKTTKFNTTPHTVELDNGIDAVPGLTKNINAKIIETPPTIIALLESVMNKPLDVLLRVIGKSKYYRLQYCALKFSPAFLLSYDEANGIDITIMRGAKKLSDSFDQGILERTFTFDHFMNGVQTYMNDTNVFVNINS